MTTHTAPHPAGTLSTLLLRLDAPLQAWGAPGAAWETRPTLTRPTRTGVLGILRTALGHDRDTTDPDWFTQLRVGFRADRPGHLLGDYHTAGGGRWPFTRTIAAHHPDLAATPDRFTYGAPAVDTPDTPPGWRNRGTLIKDATYLADAAFVAAITGDTNTLEQARDALTRPAHPVFLGRRGCPPATGLVLDTLPGDHHDTWADTVPLLPNATTTTPTVWIETTDPHHTLAYENPTGPAANRTYTGTRYRTYTTQGQPA